MPLEDDVRRGIQSPFKEECCSDNAESEGGCSPEETVVDRAGDRHFPDLFGVSSDELRVEALSFFANVRKGILGSENGLIERFAA